MAPKANDTALMNLIATSGPLVWLVPREELGQKRKGDSHKKLVELLEYAREQNRLEDIVGRVVLNFQGFDADPREVFEVEECRKWLLRVEKDVTYLFLALEPRIALPILMFCYVPFEKVGTKVMPDMDKAMGFLLDCAFTAYELARIDEVGDAKKAAADFLVRAGLGHEVNADLLNDFERTFEQERA